MSPSSPRSLAKRKKPSTDLQSMHPTKKAKKDEFVQEGDKGKGRDREFQVVTATLVVSVPPMFAGNPRAGVEELLDSMIMRYIPSLQGVVVSHSNLTFTSNTSTIKGDCPFLVCDIKFDATVWNPRVGMKLRGRINLSSPDHISLLVHRTFNVSIPRHHIPSEVWEFEYGPAENDPEYGRGTEDQAAVPQQGEASEHTESSGGRWIHRSTGDRLGGEDGALGFTVIGLTVANEMLSLLGSIQEEPFSPEHATYPPGPKLSKKTSVPEGRVVVPSDLEQDAYEEESGDEDDAFQLLKRKAIDVENSETEEIAEVVAQKVSKPSKKKKRKSGGESGRKR